MKLAMSSNIVKPPYLVWWNFAVQRRISAAGDLVSNSPRRRSLQGDGSLARDVTPHFQMLI
jgi:hypothetical protein